MAGFVFCVLDPLEYLGHGLPIRRGGVVKPNELPNFIGFLFFHNLQWSTRKIKTTCIRSIPRNNPNANQSSALFIPASFLIFAR